MSGVETLILGGVAGITIFLGLPFARLKLPVSAKALLNAIAAGILLFLLWDVLTHAIEPIEEALEESVDGGAEWGRFISFSVIFFGCLGAGLLSLVYYDAWLSGRKDRMRRGPGTASVAEFEPARSAGLSEGQRLALFIAMGIGLHNFSEGLAIGQSAAAGEIALALTLIAGFALHNATEGFGIIAPLSSERSTASWSFLLALGVIGGGPTFLGTVVGRSWVSEGVSIAFLGLAAGSILYVINELLHVGQIIGSKQVLMWGVLVGLSAGIITDWAIEAASDASASTGERTEVAVAARDFGFDLDRGQATPGRFRFSVTNGGANAHEFLIVKTDLAAGGLPVRGDGIDAGDARLMVVDEVENIRPGESEDLRVSLDAGHYVLLCDLPGHYQSGMHADFTVAE